MKKIKNLSLLLIAASLTLSVCAQTQASKPNNATKPKVPAPKTLPKMQPPTRLPAAKPKPASPSGATK